MERYEGSWEKKPRLRELTDLYDLKAGAEGKLWRSVVPGLKTEGYGMLYV